MRPIATQRSVLRYPLDRILGSEAHVRLLRALLHETDVPLGVPDAAKLAGLTPAGARRALQRLEETGFVQRVGAGRTLQYGVRRREPIVTTLAQLFAQEEQRYDTFVSGLRAALENLHELQEVWVESLPAGPREPVEIVMVAETDAADWMAEEVRSRLRDLEKDFDLIVEVSLFTRADAPNPAPEALHLWMAEVREEPGTRHQPLTHIEAEERSLALARGITELIRSDPSLIKRARQHLNRLVHEGQGTATGDIVEWRQLLETYSPERLRDLLVSESSRARRLRQSSPFFAVLTADERDRLLASMEEQR